MYSIINSGNEIAKTSKLNKIQPNKSNQDTGFGLLNRFLDFGGLESKNECVNSSNVFCRIAGIGTEVMEVANY